MTDVPPEGQGAPPAQPTATPAPQPAYPQPAEAAYSQPAVPTQPGAYPESAAYPQQPAPYQQQPAASPQATAYQEPAATVYPAQPGYPSQPEYAAQPGYPYPAPGGAAAGAVALPLPTATVAGPSLLQRARLVPTLAVAAIIGVTVLGGFGVDSVLAKPSAGTVEIGAGLQVEARPGWLAVDNPDLPDGVTLQNGSVVLMVQSHPNTRTDPHSLIKQFIDAQGGTEGDVSNSQITFGQIEEGDLGGNSAAAVGFSAIANSGPIDGEEIVVAVGSTVVEFTAVAPQGDLQAAVDDITATASSVAEVSK